MALFGAAVELVINLKAANALGLTCRSRYSAVAPN